MYLQVIYNKLNNFFSEREDITYFKSDKNFMLSDLNFIVKESEIYIHDVNVSVDRMDTFNATNLVYYGRDLKKVTTDVNILIIEDSYRERFVPNTSSTKITSSEIDLSMYIFIPMGEEFFTDDKLLVYDICQKYSFIIFNKILHWNVTLNTRLQAHLLDCNDYGIYIDWVIPDTCKEINPYDYD